MGLVLTTHCQTHGRYSPNDDLLEWTLRWLVACNVVGDVSGTLACDILIPLTYVKATWRVRLNAPQTSRNNYPTIPDMISTWHVDQTPLDSPINTNHRMTPETLFKELLPKYEAGFNLSIADLLGRGFATEFTVSARIPCLIWSRSDTRRREPMAVSRQWYRILHR